MPPRTQAPTEARGITRISKTNLDAILAEIHGKVADGHWIDADGILDLNNKGIGAAEAIAIAEALKKCTSVTQLNLANNNIRYPGAQAIAEATKTHLTITYISIEGNYLSPKDATQLSDLWGLKEETGSKFSNLVSELADASNVNNKVTFVSATSASTGSKGETAADAASDSRDDSAAEEQARAEAEAAAEAERLAAEDEIMAEAEKFSDAYHTGELVLERFEEPEGARPDLRRMIRQANATLERSEARMGGPVASFDKEPTVTSAEALINACRTFFEKHTALETEIKALMAEIDAEPPSLGKADRIRDYFKEIAFRFGELLEEQKVRDFSAQISDTLTTFTAAVTEYDAERNVPNAETVIAQEAAYAEAVIAHAETFSVAHSQGAYKFERFTAPTKLGLDEQLAALNEDVDRIEQDINDAAARFDRTKTMSPAKSLIFMCMVRAKHYAYPQQKAEGLIGAATAEAQAAAAAEKAAAEKAAADKKSLKKTGKTVRAAADKAIAAIHTDIAAKRAAAQAERLAAEEAAAKVAAEKAAEEAAAEKAAEEAAAEKAAEEAAAEAQAAEAAAKAAAEKAAEEAAAEKAAEEAAAEKAAEEAAAEKAAAEAAAEKAAAEKAAADAETLDVAELLVENVKARSKLEPTLKAIEQSFPYITYTRNRKNKDVVSLAQKLIKAAADFIAGAKTNYSDAKANAKALEGRDDDDLGKVAANAFLALKRAIETHQQTASGASASAADDAEVDPSVTQAYQEQVVATYIKWTTAQVAADDAARLAADTADAERAREATEAGRVAAEQSQADVELKRQANAILARFLGDSSILNWSLNENYQEVEGLSGIRGAITKLLEQFRGDRSPKNAQALLDAVADLGPIVARQIEALVGHLQMVNFRLEQINRELGDSIFTKETVARNSKIIELNSMILRKLTTTVERENSISPKFLREILEPALTGCTAEVDYDSFKKQEMGKTGLKCLLPGEQASTFTFETTEIIVTALIANLKIPELPNIDVSSLREGRGHGAAASADGSSPRVAQDLSLGTIHTAASAASTATKAEVNAIEKATSDFIIGLTTLRNRLTDCNYSCKGALEKQKGSKRDVTRLKNRNKALVGYITEILSLIRTNYEYRDLKAGSAALHVSQLKNGFARKTATHATATMTIEGKTYADIEFGDNRGLNFASLERIMDDFTTVLKHRDNKDKLFVQTGETRPEAVPRT